MARYDIVDGVRRFSRKPTIAYQRTVGNVSALLDAYERRTHSGQTILPPCDVLITRNPLRTRQPDEPLPLLAAPELVVETLFPGETQQQRADKIADYCAVGVRECWVASPDTWTVEVLRLSPEGAETISFYGRRQTVASVTFPDLCVLVDDIFAE